MLENLGTFKYHLDGKRLLEEQTPEEVHSPYAYLPCTSSYLHVFTSRWNSKKVKTLLTRSLNRYVVFLTLDDN